MSKSLNKKVKEPTEIDQFVQNEEIKLELKKLSEDFTEFGKKYDSIQASLDLIYNDRDLIKDIKADMEGLKGLILAFDKHNENLTQDLKKEVIDTGSKVEQSAEEVKDTVDYKTDQIKEHVGEIKKVRVRLIKSKGIIKNITDKLFYWIR